ncbi:MAG TPA: T9SS type A sorting domain-containing protein [Ignavibacteriaceae bacterium]|nr:T9SS type A sorting domain-containing protein [Ignavibacteriaceae bacterium]
MLKKILTLLISVLTLGSLSAQSFIGSLNPNPVQKKDIIAVDTVNILAVMVNFQEDKDGATFGNGKFGSIYSQNYGTNILDPLPHDKDYFESHLTFVKNYFQKVSNGKVQIQFTILPDTFSVSKTMRNYSPAPGSNDLSPVGIFAQEVWNKADQLNPTFNFSDFDLFLIFHAGVGRDISLPGSLGNERDLPSVYLSETTLKNIFGDSFTGFPVLNGTFAIKNSMIIPETESRELETITGKFLFEISINGLLAASVASHLGLPDLFDTETGYSAIGRFGLMDGQSIFAYNGCFPPEPSAWEKIYMGWAEAEVINPGDHFITLAAKLAASVSDTVILKVPLNSTEYFLIENRQRDVNNDGANIVYKSNGNIINRKFTKDTTGFYSYDTDSLAGVVLDADEFDWALPGNGIVIWHIDDNVINEKLSENKINTDKFRRGVDVEEADGVQDIGEKFFTIFGDQVIGEGTYEDFWFAGNKSLLYKNIFSNVTRPDSRTNTGANSLITIKNFSAVSNKMSFKVEYGDSIIKPLFSLGITGLSDINSLTGFGIDNKYFAFNSDNSLVIRSADSLLYTASDFSDFKPASFNIGNTSYLTGIKQIDSLQQYPSKINIISFDGSQFNSNSVDVGYYLTTPPVVRKTITESFQVLTGTNEGKILILNFNDLLNGNAAATEQLVEDDAVITQLASVDFKIFAIGSSRSADPNYDFIYSDGKLIKFNDEKLFRLTIAKDNKGNDLAIVTSEKSNSYFANVLLSEQIINKFDLPSLQSAVNYSLADIKNDGNIYLVTASDSKLYAYSLNGSLADNFPFTTKSSETFEGLSLAADIEGDSKSEIIFYTDSGKLYSIDGGTGKIVNGFPISFGYELSTYPILFLADNKINIAGIDNTNSFKGWSISATEGRLDWADQFADKMNQSFITSAFTNNTVNEFFPERKAYNYPNPVYGNQTAIRYYVNEDSKINIKIFDLAGDYVAELNDNAQGGMNNETVWNVNDIQSGVYLARIEAAGLSGKTESVVIKIAVVK